MKGKIVLTVGFYPHSPEIVHGEKLECTPEQKIKLDELHKRKIDLADEILVLNVGGYIGESTKSEIEYALRLNKPVKYWATEVYDNV
jgi:nucleoside 2-deoxyribosyltransferase